MNDDTGQNVQGRIINAFFDTQAAATTVIDELVAAGIHRQSITQTGGTEANAALRASEDHGYKGFWESLKDLFLPDDDRYTYAEGLRRGGYLVSVRTDSADYNRVLDILDNEGTVDLDERESQWRSEGWSGYVGEGLAASAASGSISAPAARGQTTHEIGLDAPTSGIEKVVASLPDAPTSFDRNEAAPRSEDQVRVGRRDIDNSRARLRSYVVGRPLTQDGDRAFGQTGTAADSSGASRIDASMIVEHMDVMSADGQMVGTVDHLDGPDRIKLAKNTSPDGQHHTVPFTWIDHIDQHVHLKKTLAEIRSST